MQNFYKDGTDQEAWAEIWDITGADPVVKTGAYNGATFNPNGSVSWYEYKKNPVTITPAITWNSTMYKWKIAVDGDWITQYGSGQIYITDSSINPLTIDFQTVVSQDILRTLSIIVSGVIDSTGLVCSNDEGSVTFANDGVNKRGTATISLV